MASGVGIHNDCLTTFQDLKIGKKYKYIIFDLNPANTEIVVKKTSSSTNYEDFLKELPGNECRWAVYDFEFDSGEGKRNKLAFYSWTPNDSKIKQKMVFASSRDAFRRALVGVALEIQGTDDSEVAYDTVLEKAKSRR